jgi:ATP-dependent Clp protease ATP-binding subunit ClpA
VEPPRPRSLLALAGDEVRRFGGDVVEPEHLLLAIVRPPEGVGAAVLGAVGVDPLAVVSETERRTPRASGPTPTGRLPVTYSVKAALERSVERARSLGAPESAVGVEHLLLALAEDERSLVAQVLRDEGVERERLRDAVVALHDAVDGALAEAGGGAPWTPSVRRAALRALASAAAKGEEEATDRRLVRALLDSDDLARALEAAGASVALGDDAGDAAARALPPGWPPAAFDAWPVFDRGAREALRRAGREAERLGAAATTAAHVVLAATRDAAVAAATFGQAADAAREVLLGLCGVDPATAEALGLRATDPDSLAAPPVGAVSFFAPDAAGALAEAVRLARRHGGSVRASHLFFALCRGAAARAALLSVPGGADFVRDEVGAAEERALADEVGGEPDVALDPSVLAVVSVAMASAASRGRRAVGAADLLLASLVDDGPAARVLRDAGVDVATLREALDAR